MVCLQKNLLDETCSFQNTRVFGKRYREIVRGWEASVRGGGTNDRRFVHFWICSYLCLLTADQNKLVWICAEHVLCCHSQGTCCGHSRTRTGRPLRTCVRYLVDFWTVEARDTRSFLCTFLIVVYCTVCFLLIVTCTRINVLHFTTMVSRKPHNQYHDARSRKYNEGRS